MFTFDPTKKTLLIGIGNPGRGDDALGWKFLEEMESVLPDIDYRYCYQLQVEDAELICAYGQVIFVDASHEHLPQGFQLNEVNPNGIFQFTTHRLSPSSVLWLSEDLYSNRANAVVVAISGCNWELGDGLSAVAATNLRQAVIQFKTLAGILSVVNEKNSEMSA